MRISDWSSDVCSSACHCSRRLAIQGRSCSAGSTLFFEAQSLGMDEPPDLDIVDLHAPFGQLGDQSAQREVAACPLKQPSAMRARQYTQPVTTHLPRCRPARLAHPTPPFDPLTPPPPKTP